MADPTLKIRIAGDLTAIRASLGQLQGELAKVSSKAKTAGRDGAKGMSEFESGISKAVKSMKALVGVAALLATGKALLDMADKSALLDAKLRLATKSQAEYNAAAAGTFDIAQKTRTGLETTVDLYARLERSTRRLNVTQGTLLQLTESINQAGQLSGGGAGVEAGLTQLAQGLQSGKLAGDELRSVLEQIPRLAEAIRGGLTDLGVKGANDLRKLAESGTLTPELVLQAILKQKDTLAAEFAKLPLTVGGAFTQLGNSVLAAFGQVDKASGTTRGLAGAISDLASTIDSLDFSPLVQFSAVTSGAFASLGRMITETANALERDLGPALAQGTLRDGLDLFTFTLKNLPALVVGAFQKAITEIIAFVDTVDARARAVKARIKAIFSDDTIDQVNKRLESELAAIEKKRQQRLDFIAQEVDANIVAGESAVARYKTEREARAKALADAKKSQAGAAINTGKGSSKGIAAEEAALLKDAIDRTLREYDRLYAEGKIRLADYFAAKRVLQEQSISADIAQAKADLADATSADQKSKLITKIMILERNRGEVARTVALEQVDAERELARALEDVQARTAELTGGDQSATRVLALKREREDLLKKFGADPQAAEFVTRLFDVELAKVRAQAIQDEAQKVLTNLRQREDNIAVQIDAGTLGQVTGEQQLQDLRDKTITQLKSLRESLAAAYAESPSDATKSALLELDTEIARVSASANKLQNDIKDLGKSSLEGFFNDIATGAANAGEAFRNLVVSFIQGLARMASEALAKRTLLALTNLFTSGTSAVGVNHGGGMAGRGMVRTIPAALAAAMVAGAPRFHSGGFAGLNPGEVPAILQTGEQVLSRQETQRYNAGDRPAPGTRVVNVFDPSFVPDQMSSAEGERVILNVIGRNPGRVRQLLG
jgi:tape measure domain-containing protein